MAMMLSRARRLLQLRIQSEMEEQLASVSEQLMQVGEIIGRLNAVATRFEDVAARIVNTMDEEDQDGDRDHTGPQR